MGIMALYYHIVYKALLRGQQPFASRPQGQRAYQSKPQQPQPQAAPIPNRVGKIMFFAIIGLFIFFLVLFINLFSDDEEYATQLSVEPEALIQAQGYYNNQQYREAIQTLRPLVTEEVNDVRPIIILGDSYYNMQQFDSAYVWYNDAYELGERSPFLCHALAYMLDVRGQTDAAIPLYKESLSMDSARLDVYQRLSELEPQNSALYLRLKQQYSTNQ